MRLRKLFALLGAALVFVLAGTSVIAPSAHAAAPPASPAAGASPAATSWAKPSATPSPSASAKASDPCDHWYLVGLAYQACEAGLKQKCQANPADPTCAFLKKDPGSGDPVSNALSDALNSTAVKPMAQGLAQFDLQMLKQGVVAGLGQKSVSITDSGVTTETTVKTSNGPVTYSLQAICLGVGEMFAITFMIWASIRTVVQRKGTPLTQAFLGLAINVLVTVCGIAALDGLLALSDTLTTDLLAVPFGSNFDLGDRMGKVLLLTEGYNPMAQLVMALVVLVLAVGLAVGMFLRQAALPAQALLLPIAGAGQLGGEGARKWLPRLWTSMFVVIAYKPCAAFLVALGFMEIGHGIGLADWIRGVVTLLAAILAVGALMRIFAPLGMAAAGASSGGFSQMLMAGAMMSGRFSGPAEGGGGSAAPTTAVQQAAAMARTATGTGGGSESPTSAVQQANRADAVRTPSPGAGDGGVYLPQQTVAEAGGTPEEPSAAPAQAPVRPQYTMTMRTAEGVSAAASTAADTMTGSEGSES